MLGIFKSLFGNKKEKDISRRIWEKKNKDFDLIVPAESISEKKSGMAAMRSVNFKKPVRLKYFVNID